MILDVGCGDHLRGDVGLDVVRTKSCDVVGDAHFLPFRDGYFDGLIAHMVLEHLENPSVALRGFMRVLKPNGTAKLVTPMPWFTNICCAILVRFLLNLPGSLFPLLWRRQFIRLTWLRNQSRTRHKSVITREYMVTQGWKTGFEVVEFEEFEDIFFGFFPRRLLNKHRWFQKLFQLKPKLCCSHRIVLKNMMS